MQKRKEKTGFDFLDIPIAKKMKKSFGIADEPDDEDPSDESSEDDS